MIRSQIINIQQSSRLQGPRIHGVYIKQFQFFKFVNICLLSSIMPVRNAYMYISLPMMPSIRSIMHVVIRKSTCALCNVMHLRLVIMGFSTIALGLQPLRHYPQIPQCPSLNALPYTKLICQKGERVIHFIAFEFLFSKDFDYGIDIKNLKLV